MTRTTMRLLIGLILILSAASRADTGLKGLLLTSPGVYHDYRYQTEALTSALAAEVNIQFDVSLQELQRWKTTDFGQGYDVILYNICVADITDEELINNMRRQIELLGTPAVVVHCTMHSFRDTEKWWPMLGLKTTNHEAIGTMAQRHATEHPILTGIPVDWTVAHDELYINLDFSAEPLLTAPGEDGKDHVTTWIKTANATRVFGTTLGHSTETIDDPVFRQLLVNGLLWATGNLSPDGRPRAGLAADATRPAVGAASKAEGIDYMDEDARGCMESEIVWEVGPCFIGCSLHPLKWGAQADACRDSCIAAIPDSDELMRRCNES